jgi:hypothetical protein
MFKVSKEKPPMYERAKKEFGVDWDRDRVIFTYGDTAYCKDGGMSPDLVVHEKVHMKQQLEIGKDIWWDKYFADPNFRLEQELEAYGAQVEFIKKFTSKKKVIPKLDWILHSIVKFYGNMITLEDAKLKLRI